jgi:phage terminase large subunit-like protein
MLLLDNEPGAEIAVAAGDRAQAGILFDMAKRFIESCPSMATHCKVYRNSIAVPSTGSRFITVSSDAGTAHGLNLSCAIVDECHVHKSRELTDTLISSMGSRRQPLTAMITTAGFSLGGWAHREFEKADRVQRGEISSSHYYPFVAAADPKDDPFLLETALKANPGLGVTLKLDYFEKWIEKAKASTSDEATYRTLHLNQWVSSENRWLKASDWPAVMTPLSEDLSGPAFIGVDLSSTQDTTAVSIIWPQDDGTVDIKSTCYIPGDIATRKEQTDRVPYRDWAKKGWAKLTDGDVVDYDIVLQDIIALCEQYDVRHIAVDRWNAQSVIAALQAEHLPVVTYGQGMAAVSPPLKLLHAKILRREVRAGDNAALRWQFTNAAVKSDTNENLKLVKPTSTSPERIDMAVATVMAVGVGGSHVFDTSSSMEIQIL